MKIMCKQRFKVKRFHVDSFFSHGSWKRKICRRMFKGKTKKDCLIDKKYTLVDIINIGGTPNPKKWEPITGQPTALKIVIHLFRITHRDLYSFRSNM